MESLIDIGYWHMTSNKNPHGGGLGVRYCEIRYDVTKYTAFMSV